MGSIPNTVYYCSVSKGRKVIAAYTRGDAESEKLAALCLEKTPPFHAYYFQTVHNRTFAFLMEEDHVYFSIADEGLGKSGVLEFLANVRDHFKKVARNGAVGGLGLTSFCLHEELVPVLRRLIMSLENVSRMDCDRENQCSTTADPDVLVWHNQDSSKSSTKGTFQGKAKYEKISREEAEIREDVAEDQGNASNKGPRIDVVVDSNQNGVRLSACPLQKNAIVRVRAQQLARRIWWRHVWIVLVIDVLLCLILFVIWLGVCRGLKCV